MFKMIVVGDPKPNQLFPNSKSAPYRFCYEIVEISRYGNGDDINTKQYSQTYVESFYLQMI